MIAAPLFLASVCLGQNAAATPLRRPADAASRPGTTTDAKPAVAAPAKVATPTTAKPPAPEEPLSAYRKIAMMPLSSLGSTEEAARSIQRILIGEVRKLLGNRLVLDAELQRQGAHVTAAIETCQGVVDCLLEVFGGLGWDAFIVGNVAGIGEGRVINLKLIDVHVAKEIRRASEKASGEEKQLIANMRKAAVELLAPQQFVGTLQISALQPNVNIMIDGQLAGRTPLTTSALPLVVGRHAIEATGEGLVPFSSFVDIAYEETVPVKIDLPANGLFIGGGTPFRNRWWTWVAAGVGVIGVGVGAYFNYMQWQNVHDIENKYHQGQLNAGSSELYSEEKANWNRAVGFYIGGGVVLGTIGALYTIDFF
jgi:hypothetical protein